GNPTMATNAQTQSKCVGAPIQADAAIPKDSELPNRAEIRKSDDAQTELSLISARSRTAPTDNQRAVEQHEGLYHKILMEAKKLGFSVEQSEERKGDSLISNCILVSGNVTIALEIAANFTRHVFERI